MISKSKEFIFIHIPKTGGNSIQNLLQKYSDDKIVIKASYQDGIERFEIENKMYNYTKHAKLADYKNKVEPKTYNKMFKFAVVRNPWDRLISLYFSPHRGVKEFNRGNFMKLLKGAPILAYYTTEMGFIDKIKNRLGLFDKSKRCLDSDIDFYIRFERLEEDFKILCQKVKIPFESLPQHNKSERKHYSSYYDEALKQLVARKYKQEIAFFNYKFNDVAKKMKCNK